AEVRNPQGATRSEPAILTVAPADTAPVITNSPVSQTVFAGAAEIQLLAGSARLGTVSFSEIPASWQLAAAGDFTGDALPDLVFQDGATGERTVLALTRLQADGLRPLPALPFEWDIAGAGDFNADGSTDLLLENLLTGECQLWLLRGTTSLGRLSLGRPGAPWAPAGATDLNGDGRSDILWEHPVTGGRLAWLLPAAGVPVVVPLGRENPGWTLAH
ncbi:MAG: FG-GAP repeat domain-containing protein, partial [Verrucomicrobiota bacterium]